MNIILIGMRGSGKSSIGMKLAEALTLPLVETDKQVEEKMQLSIREIVESIGWDGFRAMESEVIDDVSQMNNVIIATGGGAIINPQNTQKLKSNGYFIYLTAPTDTLFVRIKDDANRPLLTDAKTLLRDIQKTYEERKELYVKTAEFIINTDKNTIDENVLLICDHLKNSNIL